MEAFAREQGWDCEVVAEVASGVNENRRGLLKVLNRARRGELDRVVVEYEDRLARFGLGYLRAFLQAFGVELVILNGKERKELGEELAEDLVAIVASFAARIYGKRGGSRKGDSGEETGQG